MKLKIEKAYEVRPGRVWQPGATVETDNELGNKLIEEGHAREIRTESRTDKKGHVFQVEVEQKPAPKQKENSKRKE